MHPTGIPTTFHGVEAPFLQLLQPLPTKIFQTFCLTLHTCMQRTRCNYRGILNTGLAQLTVGGGIKAEKLEPSGGAQSSRRAAAAACTRKASQEITLEQEQGQGKHVGAVRSGDEVEDGWLLLEKKQEEKKGGEQERKSQPYGLGCRQVEPRLHCRRWRGG